MTTDKQLKEYEEKLREADRLRKKLRKITLNQIYSMSDQELLNLDEECRDIGISSLSSPKVHSVDLELFARKIHPAGLHEDRLEEIEHSNDHGLIPPLRRDFQRYLRARANWQWQQIPDTRPLRVIRS